MPQQPIRERLSSVVFREGDDRVVVTDLDLAIYCYMVGLECIDAVQLGPGRHELFFRDPGMKIRGLEVEFANSVCAKYAGAQRSLKRLMRGFVGQRTSNEWGPVLREVSRRKTNEGSSQGGTK